MEDKRIIRKGKYTKVVTDKEYTGYAPSRFRVFDYEDNLLQEIAFQDGAIKEAGVNGICNEELIEIILCRLHHFQNTEFQCEENAEAIKYLLQALYYLEKRTKERIKRGVEGTHRI